MTPNLKIDSASHDKNSNKIKIKNLEKFSAANLRVEACAINLETESTVHFKIDQSDFLILPGKKKGQDNLKTFRIISLSDSAPTNKPFDNVISDIESGKYKMRVRIHSTHDFSGLGKADEAIIRLDSRKPAHNSTYLQ